MAKYQEEDRLKSELEFERTLRRIDQSTYITNSRWAFYGGLILGIAIGALSLAMTIIFARH